MNYDTFIRCIESCVKQYNGISSVVCEITLGSEDITLVLRAQNNNTGQRYIVRRTLIEIEEEQTTPEELVQFLIEDSPDLETEEVMQEIESGDCCRCGNALTFHT